MFSSTHLGVRLDILDLEVVAWCRCCETSCRRGRAYLSPFIAGESCEERMVVSMPGRFEWYIPWEG